MRGRTRIDSPGFRQQRPQLVQALGQDGRQGVQQVRVRPGQREVKGSTGPYEEMMDSINSGWIDFGVPGAEHVPGTTTPAQVFGRARKG